MRRINVFSVIAILVLIMVLGCKSIPANVNLDEPMVKVETEEKVAKTATSSAVFLNPELEKANEDNTDKAGETGTSSAVFVNPELLAANNN